MKKRASLALALLAAVSGSLSTGCMGTQGLTGKVKRFNLDATENRWGREGIYLLFSVAWIYRICTVLDLFIFNSIEFWSGKNVINGKSPLVDVPASKVEQMGFRDLEKAQVELVSQNDAKLYLDFQNGDHLTFDVHRDQASYTVSYLGRVFFQGNVNSALAVEAAQ
jgi:uncharacterized protein DUF3332